MQEGRQWIHFDAQFPLGFGHDLCERFGPAGQLLFVQFLCACKLSFPQGQIRYRTEDEARLILGAVYRFEDDDGTKWTLPEYWKWCGLRNKTRTTTRNGRTTVTATRWEAWEDAKRSKNSERMRRSRAESVRARATLRGEGRGVRGEVGGLRGEGGPGVAGDHADGPLAKTLRTQVEEIQNQAHRNGDQP
jgi:hypothetical protein